MSEFAPPNPETVVYQTETPVLPPYATGEALSSAQMRANIELLESKGDFSNLLVGSYEAAVEEVPELAEVKILSKGAGDEGFGTFQYTGGKTRHKGETESGRHEVILNLEDGMEHYHDLFTARSSTVESITSKLGITQLSPEQLVSFTLLHELGHVYDYVRNAPDLTVRNERRERDLKSLPIPGFTPAGLTAELEGGSLDKWFTDHQADLRNQFGIESKQDLVDMQDRAYRRMKTEDIPDQFAVRIMKKLGLA